MTRYGLFGMLVLATVLICWDLGRRGAAAYEQMLIQRVENGLDVLGFHWAEIRADGLQLELHGHAPDLSAQELAFESAQATAALARVTNLSTATLAPPEKRDPVRIELHRDARGITLIGQTASRRMRERLNRALARDGRDLVVQDLTGIQAAQPPRGWGPEIDVASLAATALPNAFVVVEPGQITVDAQASDEAERDAITNRLLEAAEGKVAVILHLRIPAVVIAPFTFAAHKDAGAGIRIEQCAVRSAEEQVALLGMLRRLSIDVPSTACPVGLGGPNGEWEPAIGAGLEALQALPAGRLEITYRDAMIDALPPTSPDEFDAVITDLSAALPTGFTSGGALRSDDAATVASIQRGRYWAYIKADEDGMHLTGQVRDETTRIALATYASALVGGDGVISNLTDGEGPPPEGWQTALLKLIETLSAHGEGEAQMSGHRVTFRTTVETAEAAGRAHTALIDSLPDFQVTTHMKVDLPSAFSEIALPGIRCADALSRQIVARPVDFDTGSSVLTSESQAVMDTLIETLNRCNGDPIEIGGHTDAQGSADLNLRLSQSRAEAVRNALIERGVPLDMLVARGYGESEPIADNKTEAGRARNRRIEFKALDRVAQAADTSDDQP
ncbi:MAG: OmpA family protein [Pseudomonadota bacterium]